MRLDRWLAEHGVGSRKEVVRIVRRGLVTIDGERCMDVRWQVPEHACVKVGGALLEEPIEVAIWHKPSGILVTARDPWGRDGLEQGVPELLGLGLQAMGRLDKETTGLLLFTRDGQRAQRLLHPRRAIPRRYRACVEQVPQQLMARLLAGVETSDGIHRAEQVEIVDHTVCLTVREGKHRMVRRMLHNAGASVVTLHRLSFGPIELADLALGQWRALTTLELARLDAL